MSFSEHLQEAIRLAQNAVQSLDGGPFGAVVVKDGQIVGRGWNRVTSTNDPTAHAEIVAIRDACTRLQTFSLAGCELHVSCEPCPMCLAAIYWSRIERVYYAATRHDAADAGFDDAAIYGEIGLPADQRRIPMIDVESMRRQALEAFDAWRHKEDRVPY
jgi:tRNA(Arg) A34 adenosine deaminase TadA